MRLTNACYYLIYTDLSINDIARSVGYDDVLYFSKLFRKKKGLSPSNYREIRQKEYQHLQAPDSI
ncbi:helix-turn-helix domain-containing protein [Ileibacterium valens]|uniref:helix-turn-helix domain-containing protein n=1 Tax=Ileibacterium valens TaxID=1862668 RepID=UPI0009FB0973